MKLGKIFFACVLLFGAYRLFNPTIPTTQVLVVTGCSKAECSWKSMTKEEFGGRTDLWEQTINSRSFVVINNTGRSLTMNPISYSRGGIGTTNETPFRIPKGKSVQKIRPQYLMKTSPETISLPSTSLGVTIHWELWCR